MESQEYPICPKCLKNDKVERLTGCLCMSCPPWICKDCKLHDRQQGVGYEFYDDLDYEEDLIARGIKTEEDFE